MIYLYKSQIDYLLVLFLIVGGTIIGYFIGLEYLEIALLDIFILAFISIMNFAYSDVELKIDCDSGRLEYRYFKFGTIKEEIFLLKDLNFEYKKVITSGGMYNKFYLRKGDKTIIRPRVNIYSLSVDQIENLANKLKELGVQGEDKT